LEEGKGVEADGELKDWRGKGKGSFGGCQFCRLTATTNSCRIWAPLNSVGMQYRDNFNPVTCRYQYSRWQRM